MSTDTVPVQDIQEVVEQPIEQVAVQTEESIEQSREEMVPVSAIQKERRKRQEAEQERNWYREQMMQQKSAQPQEPDYSQEETITRAELAKSKKEVVRQVQEESWIRANPEKVSEINEKLETFLKQRPNLAAAIESASNRYEEAWELMDKLSPRQKEALKPVAPKRDAPGNPAAVPKAASLNAVVDVMSMTDSEFNAWRNTQRKRR